MADNYGVVVSFTNITDKDFSHTWNGQPFFVKARETVPFPFDLADHLATHLARRIFIEGDTSPRVYDPKDLTAGAGKALYSDEDIANMKNKILGTPIQQEASRPLTETEILARKVAALEQQFGTSVAEPGSAIIDVKKSFQDKAQVIAQLTERGIAHNPRQTKAELELLLNAPADNTPVETPPADSPVEA